MRLHAQMQGFQPPVQHPGIERGKRGPRRAQEGIHAFHQILAAQHGASQHPPLPIQVLGGGVDDDVGTQLQGLLQDRRAEAVVHSQPGAMRVGDVGERTDVADFGEWVGGRLDEEQSGIGAHRRAPFLRIGR